MMPNKTSYTDEQLKEFARRLAEKEINRKELAKETGLAPWTLTLWKKQFFGVPVTVPKTTKLAAVAKKKSAKKAAKPIRTTPRVKQISHEGRIAAIIRTENGERVKDVANSLNVTPVTVNHWRRNFGHEARKIMKARANGHANGKGPTNGHANGNEPTAQLLQSRINSTLQLIRQRDPQLDHDDPVHATLVFIRHILQGTM